MTEPFKGYETVLRHVGARHAECWFDNFDVGADKHSKMRKAALDDVKKYATLLKNKELKGRNLILFGECGTGKDHLAVAVLRVALSLNMSVKYKRGSVICSECRQSMLEECRDVPFELWNTELLVISDIEPDATQQASHFEQRALLELIDRRYTAMFPTVITSNKKSRTAMADAIGKRAVDRLYEGAIVVPMTWPSYRERK